MPRLSASLLRYAASRNRYLPRLLHECRDLGSATNELRWLADYAYNCKHHHANWMPPDARLMQYVRRRSRGEPLQYILGTQPFGELDILCQRGVLIPRLETELYTVTLANLLKTLRRLGVIELEQSIRIADLCTGTGCIALLLHSLLDSANSKAKCIQALSIVGVDASSHALSLAHKNLKHNLDAGLLNASCASDISFEQLDVLQLGQEAQEINSRASAAAETLSSGITDFMSHRWDVIVSNPPYIAPSDYAPGGTVSRSVRDHEPKSALVPPAPRNSVKQHDADQADQFYEALLHIARHAQSKLLVMEIGDRWQARRVRGLASRLLSEGVWVDTWRDDGSIDQFDASPENELSLDETDRASERAIVIWTGPWAVWRKKSSAEGV